MITVIACQNIKKPKRSAITTCVCMLVTNSRSTFCDCSVLADLHGRFDYRERIELQLGSRWRSQRPILGGELFAANHEQRAVGTGPRGITVHDLPDWVLAGPPEAPLSLVRPNFLRWLFRVLGPAARRKVVPAGAAMQSLLPGRQRQNGCRWPVAWVLVK